MRQTEVQILIFYANDICQVQHHFLLESDLDFCWQINNIFHLYSRHDNVNSFSMLFDRSIIGKCGLRWQLLIDANFDLSICVCVCDYIEGEQVLTVEQINNPALSLAQRANCLARKALDVGCNGSSLESCW